MQSHSALLGLGGSTPYCREGHNAARTSEFGLFPRILAGGPTAGRAALGFSCGLNSPLPIGAGPESLRLSWHPPSFLLPGYPEMGTRGGAVRKAGGQTRGFDTPSVPHFPPGCRDRVRGCSSLREGKQGAKGLLGAVNRTCTVSINSAADCFGLRRARDDRPTTPPPCTRRGGLLSRQAVRSATHPPSTTAAGPGQTRRGRGRAWTSRVLPAPRFTAPGMFGTP